MITNYLKVTLRSIVKLKLYSFINVFGLALGIACFLLIYSYVHNELTYDNYHKNADCIYRIYRIERGQSGAEKSALTANPLVSALRNDCPDIMKVASISSGVELPLKIGNNTYQEDISEADEEMLSMFDFPFLKGNPQTALKNMSSVIITEDFAKKYFGSLDAIGKTITILNKYDFSVTGVLKRIPANSSIQFQVVIPAKFRKYLFPEEDKKWYSSGKYTYVQLSDKALVSGLEFNLKKIKEKYLPDYLKSRIDFGVQPIGNIHLNSGMKDEIVSPVSRLYLYSLMGIAIAVLFIACINFINIAIARHTERTKEIGIRKVLGSGKYQLVVQLLSDSVLLSYAALLTGAALAEIFMSEFNRLTGKELELLTLNFLNIIALLGFGLFVGVISGAYPAFYLSSFSPVEIFRKTCDFGSRIYRFRKLLIILQFTVSVILVICALIMSGQLQYLKNSNLGFKKENIVVVPISQESMNSDDRQSKIDYFVNTIKENRENSGIISAAVSEHTPGYYYNNIFGVVPEGGDKDHPFKMIVTSIDENFLKTYKISLIEGRNFSSDFATDKLGSVLLNETALRKLGWYSAEGKSLSFAHGDGPFKVIGVINDIHFKSLQNQVEPLVIRYAGSNFWRSFLSVRIQPDNVPQTLNYLKDSWHKIMPEAQFEYFFIEDKYNEAYKAEEKIVEIIGIFAFVAITLACLGLFGLTALMVTQRSKEIGIRKVLGASIGNIVILISKQFILMIIIANLFAWPAAFLLMKGWLQDYPYRISINMGFFIFGGLLVLLIALMTISFQAVKAAMTDPVSSLKYE